ncbi:regulator of sigma E protease [Angulomicrobium tetraedrale]|uniref:Zinc metalloprotease n=1 Tax=Ancylobacter tetraedralis TaxID=217068 RepID=A0A839Z4E8_9HYPH|nr:RIP metalloprotease RseP [Ancylobacter tetraedralis]MBB3770469.1 regulator of sigma E protease [Ancylobacter tetraedralis]
MEILASMGGNASWLLGYVVPFLFVLTIVVFFHELGHFWVARRAGVSIVAFSIGFGPELIGFNDRHGTRWKISAIPLGGYVKFLGDDNAASTPDRGALARMSDTDRRGSFFHKSVGARAAIVAAGPIANFILAIVIFAGLFMVVGRPVTTPQVDTVQAGSAAERAGFAPNDIIVSIDGTKVDTFGDMQRIVSTSADRPLAIEVERAGQVLTLTATPDQREIKDSFGNTHRIGVLGISRASGGADARTERFGPVDATVMATREVWFIVDRTFSYLGGVVTGRESADQLGGPIRIAQVSGQVATFGIAALLQLAAVLSVSIGLLNLFPVPLLDGGHLLFYAIEALRGRPLSDRAQEVGFRIGLALVLMLMLFATWNDILNISKS